MSLDKVRAEIKELEEKLKQKKDLVAKAEAAALKVVQAACSHSKTRWTGRGVHGSDKGDEYTECIDCGVTFTNDKLDRRYRGE